MLMKMQKSDWSDYVSFLRGEISASSLQEPKTIAEAYNNFNVMQDLEDVLHTKLGKSKTFVKA